MNKKLKSDININKLTDLLKEELLLSEEILKITKELDREIQTENFIKVQEVLKNRQTRLNKLQNIESKIANLLDKHDEKPFSNLKLNKNIESLVKSIRNIMERISDLNKLYTERLNLLEDEYSENLKLMEKKRKKK